MNKPMKTVFATMMTASLIMPATIAVVTIAAPQPAYAKKSKQSEDTIKVAKGTEFVVKLDDGLDSGKNEDGDLFTAAVSTGLLGDKTLKGFSVNGHVEGVKAAKAFGKKGELDIVIDELVSPSGAIYPVEAELASAPKPEGKFLRNAALVFGGAIAGHHIGKKTGKKHGALAGAASAAAVALTMPGGDVKIKSGTKMTIKLDKAVNLDAAK